jgi:hypothetical protein
MSMSVAEAQNRIHAFEKAASLTKNLIEQFGENELGFDSAMSGALTVMLQALLRGSSDQTQAMGLLGSALSIAVALHTQEDTPDDEYADILEPFLKDDGSLH